MYRICKAIAQKATSDSVGLNSGRGTFALCVAVLSALIAFGCGGGGGGSVGGQSTALPKVSISWAARSRAINAPGSALSAVLTLSAANPTGGDFVYSVDRDAAPGAYSQTYTSTLNAKTGQSQATISFYAGSGGSGAVVATAHESVVIRSDGSGIGDVTLTGSIAATTVTPGQVVAVGVPQQLTFSATDAQGQVVAVSPGSATWSVASGASNLSLTQDGIGTATAVGTATVTAVVDGKTSAATAVAIVQNFSKAFSVQAIVGPGLPPGWAVTPAWINSKGDVAGYIQAGGVQQAFLWKNGAFVFVDHTASGSSATCVNDSDTVVGIAGNAVTEWIGGLVVYSHAGGNLPPLVNASGQILQSDGSTSYLVTNGVEQQIVIPPMLGQDAGAYGLNDEGEVVGAYYDTDFGRPGYAWKDGALISNTYGSFFDYGHFAYFTGVTNSGQIVMTNGSWYLGTGGNTVQQMGNQPYLGLAINNVGQAVGSEPSYYTPFERAIYWDSDNPGSVVDLNTLIPANSGWFLRKAIRIGDNGQIVGLGTLNGVPRAFLLTPGP